MSPTRFAGAGALALTALALSACASNGADAANKPDAKEKAIVAQTIEAKSMMPATRDERDAAGRLELLGQAGFWGKEYEKNPNEYEAALKLSQVLRAIGSIQRASEISQQALNLKPGDVELTLVFAQASLDQGRPDLATSALAKAEANGQGDWRMLSVIGVTMDQMGQQPAAQDYYKKALALSPNNPKILSNLGLSYALDNKPQLAEETLREAAALKDADPRVRQNLALVLGVQGKFAEAAKAEGTDTPKELVDSNEAYFHALLSPARRWDSLRGAQN